MVWTDYGAAVSFQQSSPHTFNALQKLVMAMADYQKNRGRKTFFGRDKGLIAYKAFEEALRDTLLAMVLDGAIKRTAPAAECRDGLVGALGAFETAFPNWKDAYAFAREYLVQQSAVAEQRIHDLMRR